MRQLPTDQPAKQLESWESGPLWALGLSNGLNIVLWYVLSMVRVQSTELAISVPQLLVVLLPWAVVVGGVLQAGALDGALIATISGARHGRVSKWTWITIVGAGLFSAAISYAVHSGRIDQLPGLHVASAVVLVFYNMHLAQPRKPLQPVAGADPALNRGDAGDVEIREIPPLALTGDQAVVVKPCRYCNQPVTLAMAGQHGRQHAKTGRCVAD